MPGLSCTLCTTYHHAYAHSYYGFLLLFLSLQSPLPSIGYFKSSIFFLSHQLPFGPHRGLDTPPLKVHNCRSLLFLLADKSVSCGKALLGCANHHHLWPSPPKSTPPPPSLLVSVSLISPNFETNQIRDDRSFTSSQPQNHTTFARFLIISTLLGLRIWRRPRVRLLGPRNMTSIHLDFPNSSNNYFAHDGSMTLKPEHAHQDLILEIPLIDRYVARSPILHHS
jgi:hypothetical protein